MCNYSVDVVVIQSVRVNVCVYWGGGACVWKNGCDPNCGYDPRCAGECMCVCVCVCVCSVCMWRVVCVCMACVACVCCVCVVHIVYVCVCGVWWCVCGLCVCMCVHVCACMWVWCVCAPVCVFGMCMCPCVSFAPFVSGLFFFSSNTKHRGKKKLLKPVRKKHLLDL